MEAGDPGTYVSSVLPEHLLQVTAQHSQERPSRKPLPRPLSVYGSRVQPFPNLESRPTRAFRANLPALDLFPTQIWTRLAERRLRHLSIPQLLGCDTMGYLPLRTAIAGYLNASRGTQCEPEQVMIVSGTQEALDLAGRLILNPGDSVCLEEPGYPGAAMAFEALGAKICPVPVDDEGMRLPASTQDKIGLHNPRASISPWDDHEPGEAAANYSIGLAARGPLSLKTITTANFVIRGVRYPRSRGWIVKAWCSLREASAKCCFLRCALAIWCYRPIWSTPSPQPSPSSTGMRRRSSKRCSATSWSRGISSATCGACAKSMPSGCRRCSKLPGGNSQDYCNSQTSKQDSRLWDGCSRELTARPRGGQQTCVRWKSFRCAFTAGCHSSGKDCSWVSPP